MKNHGNRMKKRIGTLLITLMGLVAQAQSADEYNGGYTINFNEDGSKSMRAILFGQMQFQDYEGHHSNDGFAIRRARVILYSQLNDRLFILTHFGLNNLRAGDLTPTGKSTSNAFALHELVVQYSLTKNFQMGAGLHYWNGISRINSSSSLTLMTLDINRASNTTLGLSDQLGMHLGVYGKGKIGKLSYRLALNDASVTSLDGNRETVLQDQQEAYLGKALADKGRYNMAGYLDYKFFDGESDLLAYQAGTYLGAKRVLNVGAGFFHHPNAIVKQVDEGLQTKAATHLGVDVFYDAPIGTNNGALTAYGLYQYSKMGDRYLAGNVVGDGNQFYGHLGYLVPKHISEPKEMYSNRVQPYVAYSYRDFKALDKAANEFRVGANWYFKGQNAKITVEYQKAFDQVQSKDESFVVQAMIFL